MRCRRRLRWVVLLVLLGGAAAALVRSRRPHPAPGPIVGGSTASRPAAAPTTEFGAAGGASWVAPVDGQCPDGYPVKANDNSGIFHMPGGRFYARTVPERCYATAEGAEADGYRRAKA